MGASWWSASRASAPRRPDWRNRAKWDAYGLAACEMFERTGTKLAPWIIVEANDKLHARLKVLRRVTDTLSDALD